MESLRFHIGQKKKKLLELSVSNPALQYKVRERSTPAQPRLETTQSQDVFENEPSFVYEKQSGSPHHFSSHMQKRIE